MRQVHLGLGNFFRAHQAAYTALAPDADEWGIAAFTGRSRELADAVSSQDGLYTLITQAPEGNHFDVIASISQAHAGTDLDMWLRYLGLSETRLLTLTVTEAAYCRGKGGGLNPDAPHVLADMSNLKTGSYHAVRSVPGRLVAGLAARRTADAGPVSVVPCDNLPDNGAAVSRVVLDMAERVDPALASWIAESVSFVTSVVDRITPRITAVDLRRVQGQTGFRDRCPVVTEPFTEWVLRGDFPAGRPRWEVAGADFVADITPFEQRKLWLLNGAHSLLAYAGSIRGHTTVREAISDDICLRWVEQWWEDSTKHVALPTETMMNYRRALLARFGNPAMHHRLDQIAADGSQKLPVRTLPVLALERE
ncbi:MAG: mannitol dehydrogenase family protein, partial [Sciscionella sp.]